jgi:hypothetical protein
VWLVTHRALIADVDVGRSGVEWFVLPAIVTPGGGARHGGVVCSRLFVRVMTIATRARVRIEFRIEILQHCLHFMAGCATLESGYEGGSGRIGCRQCRHFGDELVARNAVQRGLLLHPAEHDIGGGRLVTARLAAGLIDRREPMHFLPVTRDALDFHGVGFQMRPVPCSRSDPLPNLGFACDVAVGTDGVGHRGVFADFFWSFGHPEIELAHARENRLLMTVMAGQGIVFALLESEKRGFHDMTAGAETVVVLHVVPAYRSAGGSAQGEQAGHDGEADLELSGSRRQSGKNG